MSRTLLFAILSAGMVLFAAPGQADPPKRPVDRRETHQRREAKKRTPGEKPAVVRAQCRPPSSPAEEAIERALATPTACQFVETPLQDVVDYLRTLHKINIVFDKKSLDDVGIGTDTPITANLSDISLASALELILRPLNLTGTVYSEVLLITTSEAAESMLVTKVYPVADLVAPRGRKKAAERDCDYDALVNVITTSVAPATWDEVGGPGSVAVAPLGDAGALVISQTCQVHRRVARLLEDLRKVARENKPEKGAK